MWVSNYTAVGTPHTLTARLGTFRSASTPAERHIPWHTVRDTHFRRNGLDLGAGLGEVILPPTLGAVSAGYKWRLRVGTNRDFVFAMSIMGHTA